MTGDLDGKVALVTGATTGIGRATAEAFLERGVSALVATGHDPDRLGAMQETLSAHPGGVTVSALRWRAEAAEDAAAVAGRIGEMHGRLDVAVLNAGVTWPAPLGAIEAEAAQRQFMVNVTGPLLLVQALAPILAPGGSVILTTSCLDVLGMPGMAVYAASKAALRSLARTLSVELADRDVRVNTVAPGPVETPIYGKLGMDEAQLAEMSADIAGRVPAGRFAQPHEIAGAVAFLASDASAYMRGAEMPVDGGWSTL